MQSIFIRIMTVMETETRHVNEGEVTRLGSINLRFNAPPQFQHRIYVLSVRCGDVTNFASCSTGTRLRHDMLRQHRDKFTDNGLRKLAKHSLNFGKHGGPHYK